MNIVASPRARQLLRASTGDDANEALIKEAKQRARRRRWSYGGAVMLMAFAAAAAFTVPSSPSTPRPSGPRPVSPARPLGAPIVEGPDAASTLLTSWGAIRVGYIFVYGDGRVIFSPHDAAFLPMGATRFSVAERHLSPRGLQLVRAGKLTAKRLLLDPIYVPVKDRKVQPHGRSELWVEPTARSFEPSKYAIGVGFGADHASALDTTRAIAQLPPPAQALLAGKQRTCNPHTGTGDWSGPSGPPTECFEITPAEHATFWQILDPNGELDRPTPSHPWYEPYWPIAVDGRVGFISADPIFPHGQPVRQLGG